MRQHHCSILVKMFDILCKVTSELSGTDVQCVLLVPVHPHSCFHLCHTSACGEQQGLGWVIGLLCQLPLWGSFCHSPEHPLGLVSARAGFPHPGPSSRMSLCFICAALLPTLVLLLSKGCRGLCLLQQRWLKYKDVFYFYPDCCSHRSLNTWAKRSAGWWNRTTHSV